MDPPISGTIPPGPFDHSNGVPPSTRASVETAHNSADLAIGSGHDVQPVAVATGSQDAPPPPFSQSAASPALSHGSGGSGHLMRRRSSGVSWASSTNQLAQLDDGQDGSEDGTSSVRLSRFDSYAQPEEVDCELDSELPFQPNCLTGHLANGMAYYVRPNKQPLNRAELRVTIKVGSIYEQEHERGIAHMIEHLAFRATTSSPTEFQLVKELESYGIQFGAHQNAFTGFGETEYSLHIPTDKEGVLEKSLHMLQQLALEVRLSEEDVDRERAIIVEEWRQSRGSMARSTEHYLKLVTQGSIYEHRLPIGLMSVINNVTADTVRGFYQRYYVPSCMAVIAVGDFGCPPEEVVATIKRTFGKAKEPDLPPAPREEPTVPGHDAPRIGIFTDAEATASHVVMEITKPRRKTRDVRGYKLNITEDLFHSALTSRLMKLSLQDDPPFQQASSGYGGIVPVLESVQLTVACQGDGIMKGITAVLTEIERIKSYGLTEREVQMAKKSYQQDSHSGWIERDQIESESLAVELREHFLNGIAAPGIEWEAAVTRQLMPEITLAEVNACAKIYSWGPNTAVHITRPSAGLLQRVAALFTGRGTAEDITEESVRELFARCCPDLEAGRGRLSSGLTDWTNPDGGYHDIEDLLPAEVQPGKIVKSKHFGAKGAVDVHELELSNGMKVSYKSTNFLDDEVLFSGMASGGLTELPEARYPSGKMACIIAEEFGLFGVPPSQIVDMLSGKHVALITAIDPYARTVRGECGRQELETALQLVHLLFTAELKWDESRLKTVMSYLKEYMGNSVKSPHYLYEQALAEVNTSGHPFFAAPSKALLRKIDARFAVDYFKRMFRNPAEFHFIFVGSMKPARALPLLEKWLGSIPRPPGDRLPCPVLARTQVTPLRVQFPAQKIVKRLRVPMIEETVVSTLTFPIVLGGPVHPTHEERLQDNLLCQFMVSVLQRRLLEVLRFDLGSIYTVNVSDNFSTAPPIRTPDEPLKGMLMVTLTCPPDKVSLLHAKILMELRVLQDKGPSEKEVLNAIEAEKRSRETAERTNSYWLSSLSMQYNSPRYNGDVAQCYLGSMAVKERTYNTLTSQQLRQTFTHFLGDCQRRTEVSLLPRPLWHTVGKWTAITAAIAAVGVGAVAVARHRARQTL